MRLIELHGTYYKKREYITTVPITLFCMVTVKAVMYLAAGFLPLCTFSPNFTYVFLCTESLTT